MTQLPDDNRLALRQVVRACRKGALATLADGAPYASLVTVAFDHDLAPILLLSQRSEHTRNLMADARVSLLLDGSDGFANPQEGPRVTLAGRAEPTNDPRLARRFLALHPGAALYAGFGDFGFWRIAPDRAHFVAGFGRAVWFPAPFGLAETIVTAMSEDEEAVLAEAGLATLDPDGAFLAKGENFRRIAFATPIAAAKEALLALKAASC